MSPILVLVLKFVIASIFLGGGVVLSRIPVNQDRLDLKRLGKPILRIGMTLAAWTILTLPPQ